MIRVTLLALLAGAGCARARTTPDAPVAPVACAIATGEPGAGDTLVVAAMAPVDPSHVPASANGAERLVFAQLYERLIDVDCEGRARPALARSWTLDETRTRVALTIREDARWWSGAPIVASDVVAAWRATAAQPTDAGRLARDIANATTMLDERTLIVSLPDTAWLVLADRALAVYRPAPGASWPEGSGQYRPAASAGSPAPADVLLAPVSAAGPHLVFRQARGADARDVIDAGADLLVTGDPAAVSYAATRPALSVVPLPWTRTWVLAMPAPARANWAAALLDSGLEAIRASLARDAVRADARPAPPIPSCAPIDVGSVASLPAPLSRRLVHQRGDDVARGLAERLVALDGNAVATALSPGDFARAARAGDDLGYIIEFPHSSLSPCRALGAVRVAAPWLTVGAATVVPLVEVREHAIVRRGAVSATVTWDGTLRFGSRP